MAQFLVDMSDFFFCFYVGTELEWFSQSFFRSDDFLSFALYYFSYLEYVST